MVDRQLAAIFSIEIPRGDPQILIPAVGRNTLRPNQVPEHLGRVSIHYSQHLLQSRAIPYQTHAGLTRF